MDYQPTFAELECQHKKCNLGAKILETVNRVLNQKGLILRSGTIMDATIIEAPSSTGEVIQRLLKAWGVWWESSPYGDDPHDQRLIESGIQYAKHLGY